MRYHDAAAPHADSIAVILITISFKAVDTTYISFWILGADTCRRITSRVYTRSWLHSKVRLYLERIVARNFTQIIAPSVTATWFCDIEKLQVIGRLSHNLGVQGMSLRCEAWASDPFVKLWVAKANLVRSLRQRFAPGKNQAYLAHSPTVRSIPG